MSCEKNSSHIEDFLWRIACCYLLPGYTSKKDHFLVIISTVSGAVHLLPQQTLINLCTSCGDTCVVLHTLLQILYCLIMFCMTMFLKVTFRSIPSMMQRCAPASIRLMDNMQFQMGRLSY